MAAGTVLGILAGCGPAKSPEASQMCEAMLEMVRLCYDRGDPNVACDQVHAEFVSAVTRAGADPETQDELAEICLIGCAARKSGRPFADISSRVDCSKFSE